jgi:multidrug efflux pump subunit AcrA (membrane-fusion protein)
MSDGAAHVTETGATVRESAPAAHAPRKGGRRLRWLAYAFLGVAGALLLLGAATGRVPGLGAAKKKSPAPDPAAQRPPPEPVAVTVAAVTPRPVQRTVHVVGTLGGLEEVVITPKVEGRVARVRHDIGDTVKPGDVLLEIDDSDYRLAVIEAERAVGMEFARLGLKEVPAKEFDVMKVTSVVRAEALEAEAQGRFARARQLSGSRTISTQEYDQAQAEYSVARANKDQAVVDALATLAAVRHKQALLESARLRLRETKVMAPVPSPERLRSANGQVQLASSPGEPRVEYVVAQRMVSEGEMVRVISFTASGAFRLVIDRPLKMLATVPERHVGEVKPGQAVAVRVEAYPKEVFQGTICRVNPTVDRANRTFQVEVLVPNESRQLKCGSFAKAAIATHADSGALTIPEHALVSFAGVTKVYVVRDGKARAVPVRVGERLEVRDGRQTENWLEVTGELEPGASVVTSGQAQLVEGAPVRVRK